MANETSCVKTQHIERGSLPADNMDDMVVLTRLTGQLDEDGKEIEILLTEMTAETYAGRLALYRECRDVDVIFGGDAALPQVRDGLSRGEREAHAAYLDAGLLDLARFHEVDGPKEVIAYENEELRHPLARGLGAAPVAELVAAV